ncbi:MAG TPA: hypothetical protein PK289_01675 [Bacteroidia bacterium]|nr:hypothetical protein [Bacteroidia bacterium]HRG52612.1 hypothetical protein [Bacteroidia bacterium]
MEHQNSSLVKPVTRAILLSGFIVGTLDTLAAIIDFGLPLSFLAAKFTKRASS